MNSDRVAICDSIIRLLTWWNVGSPLGIDSLDVDKVWTRNLIYRYDVWMPNSAGCSNRCVYAWRRFADWICQILGRQRDICVAKVIVLMDSCSTVVFHVRFECLNVVVPLRLWFFYWFSVRIVLRAFDCLSSLPYRLIRLIWQSRVDGHLGGYLGWPDHVLQDVSWPGWEIDNFGPKWVRHYIPGRETGSSTEPESCSRIKSNTIFSGGKNGEGMWIVNLFSEIVLGYISIWITFVVGTRNNMTVTMVDILQRFQ